MKKIAISSNTHPVPCLFYLITIWGLMVAVSNQTCKECIYLAEERAKVDRGYCRQRIGRRLETQSLRPLAGNMQDSCLAPRLAWLLLICLGIENQDVSSHPTLSAMEALLLE